MNFLKQLFIILGKPLDIWSYKACRCSEEECILLNKIFKNWLFVGPHPDDVELGCGGSIAKYSKSNVNIYYLIISPAIEDPRNKNILQEMENAAEILGLKRENIFVLKYPRRVLHDFRADIRQDLIRVVKEVEPDVIFTTTPDDLHQDHSVIGEEILRLFRERSVIGYEVIRSSINFAANFYIELTEEHIDRKIRALMEYKSQLDRYYFNPEVIRSLAKMRGAQVKAPYAEAFKAMRLVVR